MAAAGVRKVRYALLALALIGLVLGLCSPARAARAKAAPIGVGCHSSWPVVAYTASAGGSRIATPTGPLPVACGAATGYPTSETTLAVTSSGAIFFSPAASENELARSLDGGSTWSVLRPTGMQPTSLWNTVDPQVVVDPRTGRLFWVRATHTDELSLPPLTASPAGWLVPLAIANAHGFQVDSTGDDGRTWTTADEQQAFTADWEKLFVGPAPPPTSGAAQPVGYPDVVYVCANAPLEVTGPGRDCYKSLDGGRSFSFAGYVQPSLGAPTDCPPLSADTGVVAENGTTYIPRVCGQGTYLAVSSDEGATYTWRPVPGGPTSTLTGPAVQLAMDSAGNLYALWVASDRLDLAVSRDGGITWTAPLVVSPPTLHQITLPALAAGPAGAVAIAYYASTDPSAKALSGYISQTQHALDAQPLFYAGVIDDPARPIFEDYGDAYTPRADFVGATYDSAGHFWAGVVEQLGPPDSSNAIPTSGYLGHLTFGSER